MTILLQHRSTLSYLQRDGTWQPSVASAENFPDSFAALKFCERNHLADVQVVLKFAGTEHDVQIPIKSRS